jgi:molybdopterin molybdotransferase
LAELIERGLGADVLVISGGVSAGTLDLVPGVLAQLGAEQVFHKVRVKPGKPLWFGVWHAGDARSGGSTLVFGLPGNPVSSLVCCQLFVAPAIAKMSGRGESPAARTRAALAVEFTHRGDRPLYHPARLRSDADPAIVQPLAWAGSADLHTLSEANALAIFPAGDRHYAAGETVECQPIE